MEETTYWTTNMTVKIAHFLAGENANPSTSGASSSNNNRLPLRYLFPLPSASFSLCTAVPSPAVVVVSCRVLGDPSVYGPDLSTCFANCCCDRLEGWLLSTAVSVLCRDITVTSENPMPVKGDNADRGILNHSAFCLVWSARRLNDTLTSVVLVLQMHSVGVPKNTTRLWLVGMYATSKVT